MLNVNFNQFQSGYLKKKNQVLFFSINTKGEKEIINLINNLLIEKNSFVFESVEKGKIKGRYTIFGRNPDKIWEFNNNNSYLIIDKKKTKLRSKPEKLIEKIIEEFKFKIPNSFLDENKDKINDIENAYLRHLTYVGAKRRYSKLNDEIE